MPSHLPKPGKETECIFPSSPYFEGFKFILRRGGEQGIVISDYDEGAARTSATDWFSNLPLAQQKELELTPFLTERPDFLQGVLDAAQWCGSIRLRIEHEANPYAAAEEWALEIERATLGL